MYCIVAWYKHEDTNRTMFHGTLDECRTICKRASRDMLTDLSICYADGRIFEVYRRNGKDLIPIDSTALQ